MLIKLNDKKNRDVEQNWIASLWNLCQYPVLLYMLLRSTCVQWNLYSVLAVSRHIDGWAVSYKESSHYPQLSSIDRLVTRTPQPW